MKRNWEEDIREQFQYPPYAPIIFVSALTKQRLHKLPEMIKQISESQNTYSISCLERCYHGCHCHQPTPTDKGNDLRFSMRLKWQPNHQPFVIFVNEEELMHFSYLRFLENQIHQGLCL